MAVIGELTVNLAANTAEFTDSMGKSKSELSDFGSASKAAGEKASFSMLEARGSVMLLGREFGIAMPREISRMIATIPGVGAALSSLLPIMGAVFAVGMIYKWYEASKQASEKFQKDWEAAGNAGAEALDKMQSVLLAAQKKADELAGDHLGAINIQLQQIDRQTLNNVVSEIQKMGTAADKAFDDLKQNWFVKFLMGDNGLGAAKAEMDSMVEEIVKAKNTGASPQSILDLLGVDIKQVNTEMEPLWNQMEAQKKKIAAMPTRDQVADNAEFAGAQQRLRNLQAEWNVKQKLVDQLQSMHDMSDVGVQADAQEHKNVGTEEEESAAKKRAAEFKRTSDIMHRAMEEQKRDAIAAAHSRLEGDRIVEEFERGVAKDREERGKKAVAAAQALASAKAEEVELDKVSQAKTGVDQNENQYKLGLITVQEYLSKKKDLLQQEGKAEVDYAKSQQAQAQAAYNTAPLEAQAEALHRLAQATRAVSAAQTKLKIDMQNVGAESKKDTTFFGALTSQMKQNQTLSASMGKTMADGLKQFNSALAKSIVEQKDLGAAARQVGTQVVESILEQILAQEEQIAVQYILKALHLTASGDNKAAQMSAATLAGANMTASWAAAPWPIDASAPEMGIEAMAAAMAFAHGGTVPGYGNSDSVPAMLMPGETVVTKALTDQVKSSERSSGGSGGDTHVHMNISMLDATGFEGMITKHGSMLQKHVAAAVRRANR